MHNQKRTLELLEQEFPIFYPDLYRMVCARVAHREDAEDIVGRTVETLIRRADGFDPGEGSLAAWATGVAKNHILHYWRGRRELVDIEMVDHLLEEKGWSLDSEIDCKEMLKLLNAEDRALLMLRYVDGYSAKELAQKSGKKVEAVRQKLHRIKSQYRKLIKQ